MGDPKTDVTTFGAWIQGFFGPFTSPGDWNGPGRNAGIGRRRVARGRDMAFVRVRHSYAFGLKGDRRSYSRLSPLDELRHAIMLAGKIMKLDGAIALFNRTANALSWPRLRRLSQKRSHGPARAVVQCQDVQPTVGEP